MSTCKACGTRIEWIQTPAGRYMPVDPEPVFVIEGGGTDRFVTDEGSVLLGRIARPEEQRPGIVVAFVPHWKTCVRAGSFRRRRS